MPLSSYQQSRGMLSGTHVIIKKSRARQINMPSQRFTLNGEDFWKTIRGTFITALGAGLTWASIHYMSVQYVVLIDGHTVDFSLLAVALIGALIELGRRFVTENS